MPAVQLIRKVPAITAHFWAVKILTTAMGLTIAIIAWVAYLWVTRVDVERGPAAAAGASSPARSDELDGRVESRYG